MVTIGWYPFNLLGGRDEQKEELGAREVFSMKLASIHEAQKHKHHAK